MQREGAYAAIQSTKPQSLAYALNDSPAGLAGWIIEKFRSWSDCDGDIDAVLQGRTPDSHRDLLGNRIDWILVSRTLTSPPFAFAPAISAARQPSGLYIE
jgi:hypothetical protein